MRGPCQRVVDQRDDIASEAPIIADHPQPYILAYQFIQVVADEQAQQPHKVTHLLLGTAPVLAAERVERQRLDPHRARGAGDLAHRIDARLVACKAR